MHICMKIINKGRSVIDYINSEENDLLFSGDFTITVLIVHRIVLFGNRIVASKMADRKTGER